VDIDLRALRLRKNIPAKDMVEVVKAIYPKYDKTVQSKCENGDAYGVCLRADAAEAICERFAPELKRQKQKKKDGHRLTCRISCRLETTEYEELMLHIGQDGYDTVQAWLTNIVRNYNAEKRKEQKNESGNNNNG